MPLLAPSAVCRDSLQRQTRPFPSLWGEGSFPFVSMVTSEAELASFLINWLAEFFLISPLCRVGDQGVIVTHESWAGPGLRAPWPLSPAPSLQGLLPGDARRAAGPAAVH